MNKRARESRATSWYHSEICAHTVVMIARRRFEVFKGCTIASIACQDTCLARAGLPASSSASLWNWIACRNIVPPADAPTQCQVGASDSCERSAANDQKFVRLVVQPQLLTRNTCGAKLERTMTEEKQRCAEGEPVVSSLLHRWRTLLFAGIRAHERA